MLTLFILCHNRPEDARRAIASALAQSQTPVRLIVSDNSTTEAVAQMVKANFPGIQYTRRPPGLNAFEHFNQCVAQARTDYFCLFHDDDLMLPDFVASVEKAIHAFPHVSAIGCNALIENLNNPHKERSFKALTDFVEIPTPMSLASRYFGRNQSGIAPFPGYVYNTHFARQLRFQKDGGKYGDVAWLLSLVQLAPIVWLTEPLMIYRLHGQNDGLIESRRDRLKLLAFLKSQKKSLSLGLLNDYRISFIYKPILQEQRPHGTRQKLARCFLKKYRIHRYLRSSTYKDLFSRARIKWGF